MIPINLDFLIGAIIDETNPEETDLEVYLTSVDFCCPISVLYEDVDFSIETESE